MPQPQAILNLTERDGRGRMTFVRPMVGMEGIKSFIGMNEDEVLGEIATGKIKWAFDLSAGADRQFLRVLSLSMDCWKYAALKQPATLDGVIDLILPAGSKVTGIVKGTSLQFSFNVVSEHILNLLRAGRLKLARGQTGWSTGPNGTPLITRASVETFLRDANKLMMAGLKEERR